MISVSAGRVPGEGSTARNPQFQALLIAYFNLAMCYEQLQGSQNIAQARVIYRHGYELASKYLVDPQDVILVRFSQKVGAAASGQHDDERERPAELPARAVEDPIG